MATTMRSSPQIDQAGGVGIPSVTSTGSPTAPEGSASSGNGRSRWATLAVLAVAQFVVVLDVTIVNVALPSIQSDLGFTASGLQWVISAYTLFFGGFLLLGGRAADLLGRRRTFMAGLLLFGAASLAAGFSTSPDMLVALRALQGLGGALLSPAALSLLTVTFPHGRERNVALGIWGGLAGLGGTLGVVAGGALVNVLSWRWVFFVNVPIVIAVVLITPRFVSESKVEVKGRRTFDMAGAIVGTAGLLSLVLGVIRAGSVGWTSPEVLGLLSAGAALLAVFAAIEKRSSAPLVPPRLFSYRSLTFSSVSLALNGGAFLSMFFLTALYLQQVRGLSALATGVEFLPMGIAAILTALVASQIVTKVGTRPVQVIASALSVIGLVVLSRAGTGSEYLTGILPGLVIFGVGIIGIAVPSQIAAIADVRHDEAGAASGVVTTAYQVGGAIGLAVVTTLSQTQVAHSLAAGHPMSSALTSGFHRGLIVAAAFAMVNLVMAALSPAIRPTAEMVAAASAGA